MIALLLLVLAGAPSPAPDFAEVERLCVGTRGTPRPADASAQLRREPERWLAALEAQRTTLPAGPLPSTGTDRWTNVASALARQLGSLMVPYLTGLLHGPDLAMHQEAVRLLGMTGAPEAEAPLRAALQDRALIVNEGDAAVALALIMAPASYDDIVQQVEHENALYRRVSGTHSLLTILAASKHPEALAALLKLLADRVDPFWVLKSLSWRHDLPEDFPKRLRDAWKPTDLVEANGSAVASELLLLNHPTDAGVAYMVEVFGAASAQDRSSILARARQAGEIAAPILELAAQDPALAPAASAQLSAKHPEALLAALPSLEGDTSPRGQYAAAQAVASAIRGGQVPGDLPARLKKANALNRLVLILAIADRPTAELAPLLDEWSRTGEPWTRAFALEGLARVAPMQVARMTLKAEGPYAALLAVAKGEAAVGAKPADPTLSVEVRGPTVFGIDSASGPEGTISLIEVLPGGRARLSGLHKEALVIPFDAHQVEALQALAAGPLPEASLSPNWPRPRAKVIVTTGGAPPQTVDLASDSPLLVFIDQIQARSRFATGLSGWPSSAGSAMPLPTGLDPALSMPMSMPLMLRALANAGSRDRTIRGTLASSGDGFAMLAENGDSTATPLLVEALQVDCHRKVRAMDPLSLAALLAARDAAAPCEGEIQLMAPWLQALIAKGVRAAPAVLEALQARAKLGLRLAAWPPGPNAPPAVKAIDQKLANWVLAQPNLSAEWQQAGLTSVLRNPGPGSRALLAGVRRDAYTPKRLLMAARASAGDPEAEEAVRSDPGTYLDEITQMPRAQRARYLPLAVDLVLAQIQAGHCPNSMGAGPQRVLETNDPAAAKRLLAGLGACLDHVAPTTQSTLRALAAGHPFAAVDPTSGPKGQRHLLLLNGWAELARQFPDEAIALSLSMRGTDNNSDRYDAIDLMLAADPKRALAELGPDFAGLYLEWRVKLVRAARDAGLGQSALVKQALADPSPWVRREAHDAQR